MLEKMGEFSFSHTGQQHDLYNAFSYLEIQQLFDSRAEELKVVFNNLITVLKKVNDDSGAHNIGSQTINGITGENVHAQLVALKNLIDSLSTDKADQSKVFTKNELSSTTAGNSGAEKIKVSPVTGVPGATVQELLQELKYQINSAVTGTIPDGSITPAKLTFDPVTQQELNDAIAGLQMIDTNIATTGIFAGKTLNQVLDELFISADSVKTNVSSAIGSPATKDDTGVQLAGHITTEKGRLTGAIGDGNSSNTLKYASDRLVVRKNELATQVNAKGVPATASDTLAQLVTKVSQIPLGKNFAQGKVTGVQEGASIRYTINNLSFRPKFVIMWGYDAYRIAIFHDGIDVLGTYAGIYSVHNANVLRILPNNITNNGISVILQWGTEHNYFAVGW